MLVRVAVRGVRIVCGGGLSVTEALLAVVLVRMRTSVSVCCVCGSVAVVPVAFLAIMRMRVSVTRGVGACRGVVCVCMLSMRVVRVSMRVRSPPPPARREPSASGTLHDVLSFNRRQALGLEGVLKIRHQVETVHV